MVLRLRACLTTSLGTIKDAWVNVLAPSCLRLALYIPKQLVLDQKTLHRVQTAVHPGVRSTAYKVSSSRRVQPWNLDGMRVRHDFGPEISHQVFLTDWPARASLASTAHIRALSACRCCIYLLLRTLERRYLGLLWRQIYCRVGLTHSHQSSKIAISPAPCGPETSSVPRVYSESVQKMPARIVNHADQAHNRCTAPVDELHILSLLTV